LWMGWKKRQNIETILVVLREEKLGV
jgi:hypothetical protein